MPSAQSRPPRFTDRVVAITGGASGIGLAAARQFVAEGARVAVIDRDATALNALSMERPDILAMVGDVADDSDVDRCAAGIDQRFGRWDVLFAAAGWSTGRRVIDENRLDFEAVLRTNVTGTFLWAQAAAKYMTTSGRGGSIIMVGSQLAFAGGRANAAYLAAKAAIPALARSMALDHAEDAIRVNVVVPGAIDTPLLNRAFSRAADPAAARARSIARHPLGRLGQADEVARAVLFLASDEASFTTGSCLMVDGGWLAA
jgi:2-keto-3-deoxy-L-fuconate dehydrogenase